MPILATLAILWRAPQQATTRAVGSFNGHDVVGTGHQPTPSAMKAWLYLYIQGLRPRNCQHQPSNHTLEPGLQLVYMYPTSPQPIAFLACPQTFCAAVHLPRFLEGGVPDPRSKSNTTHTHMHREQGPLLTRSYETMQNGYNAYNATKQRHDLCLHLPVAVLQLMQNLKSKMENHEKANMTLCVSLPNRMCSVQTTGMSSSSFFHASRVAFRNREPSRRWGKRMRRSGLELCAYLRIV